MVYSRAEGPRVLLLDASGLRAARAGQHSAEELADVTQRAEQALSRGPFSVAFKRVPPPGGDVQDYVSLSIYWWPDPTTPGGLPYIRRDGVRNSEADDTSRYDASSLSHMVSDVEALTLAFYLTRDRRYGAHAAGLIRTWFLDPETRMDPSFRLAQIIPGHHEVRGTGIIESRRFTRIVDSVALLRECSCWTDGDDEGLHAWFAAFENWLRTSQNGQLEDRTVNNHATWYDVQLADFALLAGNSAAAHRVLSAVGSRRIHEQIAPDGSMPRELGRPNSLHYSYFNLQALCKLATLAKHVDIDLWSRSRDEEGSLRAALDYLTPYMLSPREWPHNQIADVDAFDEAGACLKRAAEAYPDSNYGDTLRILSAGRSVGERFRLRLGFWPD